MEYQVAEIYILSRLRDELSPTLYYHGLHHTLDVRETAMRLAAAEGIDDTELLLLLRTAACFHDAGFLTTYRQHEEEGCQIARDILHAYDYSPDQIATICGMIMATQIPQTPRTSLEQILCDADLDYLGRQDFEPIANSLFRELQARDLVADEMAWNRIQVKFLESHHYWTPTAINWRQANKQARLVFLKNVVELK